MCQQLAPMVLFYLLLGLEVLVVLLVTFFLFKKIRGVIKDKKNRKNDLF